jgi:hypothetical protein
MPATDQKQVFNFENNFEIAVAGVLMAGGYGDAFIAGVDNALPASRLEVTFETGDAMNEGALPSGEHVYDFYSGKLSVRIVTFRPETQPSLLPGVSSLHCEWAAGVRTLLQERREPFTSANLPYYTVRTIRPRSTRRELDAKWLEDYTQLEFLVEFGIRPDAWPA